MTIRDNGGVFGRNPSFNDVQAQKLTVDNIVADGNQISTTTGDLEFAPAGQTHSTKKVTVNAKDSAVSANGVDVDGANRSITIFRTSLFSATTHGQLAFRPGAFPALGSVITGGQPGSVDTSDLRFSTSFGTLAERLRIDNAATRPGADNTINLGAASFRWKEIFAGNAVINTSDEREKEQIRSLTDAEKRVAGKIKGLIRAFKWKDAVAAKGDAARTHFGVIAQEVIEAFASEGLDANEYGILCYDEWEAVERVVDDEGTVVEHGYPAGSRYGIRYDELLAFVIGAL